MRRLIKTDYLARVEGEGGVAIEIKDGRVMKVHMRIFEAPRFFEAFLRGRSPQEVIDFTARICGICPVAYQMSAVHALERIFGAAVSRPARDLRRLMYCGEWIESHALHIYLLQGPDFYGLESALTDKEYIHLAKRGLGFKKLGNEILTLTGGRPIHPVSVRVGGFFRMPEKTALTSLLPELEHAYEESLAAIKWASGLNFGDHTLDAEFVSLGGVEEYPMNEGRVLSTKGLDAAIGGFLDSIQEYQVDYSTALHCGIKRNGTLSPYFVGPLSRLNLNHERLPAQIRSVMADSGISMPVSNLRMGIVARSVELAYAFYEAIMLIRGYEKPEMPCEGFGLRAGTAAWATEAPRGTLFHRYEVDGRGLVKAATIIPPTAQNFAHMEKEIRAFAANHIDSPNEFLRKETEKIVRSYDPCISCSSHAVTIETGDLLKIRA